MLKTFGARVMAFNESLERFRWATPEVAVLSPVADNERKAALAAFCDKFYNDDESRVFWLGINPSRVRPTSTGIHYTDGFALTNYCNIDNAFDQRRELTAHYFYNFIEKFGGAGRFYSRHYAGAAYPLSVLKKDKYCNYYEKDLPAEFLAAVPQMIQRQIQIGSNGVLVIIGAGENATVLNRLNEELGLFKRVFVVEHPRYIMQYKSANMDYYLEKFVETALKAESAASLG